MDLGIKGKWALVGGASKGLGLGCARALAHEGVHVVMVARGAEALNASAQALQKETQGQVNIIALAADITTEAVRAAIWSVAGGPGKAYDILVTNAGGPPPGDFRDWSRDDWLKAVDANMLTPIELIKATVDGMIARKFGRIVNITSNSVKAPIEELGLSNAARSGLTGFVAGLARKTVRHNVTINNILPGQFMTDRLKTRLTVNAKEAGVTLEQYLAKRSQVIPAGRFGDPNEFGELCAYVCSVQAAFITGQNFLIDGGTYPGTY